MVNLKGGSGKTTTAVFLAHEWATRGRSVLLVDVDPQATALRWSEQAGCPGRPRAGPTCRGPDDCECVRTYVITCT